jgi:hypothetical protein
VVRGKPRAAKRRSAASRIWSRAVGSLMPS